MLDHDDEEETFRLINWCGRCPRVTARDVMEGHCCPMRRRDKLGLLAVAALLIASMLGAGCATGRTVAPVEVESVGQLSASADHVFRAPVAKATEFEPGALLVHAVADDDAGAKMTGEAVAAPEVQAKNAHGF